MSSGTVKGGAVQPSNRLAPAASSDPRAAPCTAAVPALVGAPRPITVLHAIRVGFLDRTAKESAAAICPGSWPSTAFVAQPSAAKRFSVSSVRASAVSPSIETWLSS
jgi:hypothetical protein